MDMATNTHLERYFGLTAPLFAGVVAFSFDGSAEDTTACLGDLVATLAGALAVLAAALAGFLASSVVIFSYNLSKLTQLI